MPYRTAPERKIVKAELTLSAEEYKQAILDYLVRNKMLPDGVDVSTVTVSEYIFSEKIAPKITYKKEVVKLYESD